MIKFERKYIVPHSVMRKSCKHCVRILATFNASKDGKWRRGMLMITDMTAEPAGNGNWLVVLEFTQKSRLRIAGYEAYRHADHSKLMKLLKSGNS